MNLLDRTIRAVAPRMALRREMARVQLHEVERIRRRSEVSRRSRDSFRVNDPTTRRAEARLDKPMARHDRDTLRFVFEMNPFAVKTKSSLLNALVGYGITGTVKASKATQRMWADWIKVCDYDGVYDLYGLQQLVTEHWLDDGEGFIVQHIVAGAAVHPLRLQVLDIDMLDQTATSAGARIRDGIEYENNRPVAYHFKRSRELGSFGDAVRVPAEQVIHLFLRRRSGQWRGRPHFEPVLDVVTDIDDYLEAEGVRKKISACFVGFRGLSADADDPAMGAINPDGAPEDPAEPDEEALYPGMIINGRPGETMTFGDPKSDAGIDGFMRWGGLRMAAGAQTTYERATGDLSNVNFTSWKAGDLDFQRFTMRMQYLVLLPRLCWAIERAWVDAAYSTGLIASRAPQFKWTPPPFGSVDRGKDIKAQREEIAAGAESLRNIVAERGYDLDELSDEIAEDLKMLEKKGLLPLIATMFGKPQQPGVTDAGTKPKPD